MLLETENTVNGIEWVLHSDRNCVYVTTGDNLPKQNMNKKYHQRWLYVGGNYFKIMSNR